MSTETPNPGQTETPVIHDKNYVMHWENDDAEFEFTSPKVIGPASEVEVKRELQYAFEASKSLCLDLSEEIERNMRRINCVVVWPDTIEVNVNKRF